MTGLGGLFGGLAMTVVVCFGIVLLIMALLMPYYVYRISKDSEDLRDRAKDLAETCKASKAEQEKTNGLLRQLIKAYGHEPEA